MSQPGYKRAGVSEWQTRQTQNLLWATTCGFKSHHQHYLSVYFFIVLICGSFFLLHFPQEALIIEYCDCGAFYPKGLSSVRSVLGAL